MRYFQISGAALAAWTAGVAAAQDRSTLCQAAHERLGETWEISREMMQAPLAGIDTASQLATEMAGEQQMGAMGVLEIIVDASIAGLEDRNRRFADNQSALARVVYELCGDDWPDAAAVPPTEPQAGPDLSD